MESACVKAGAAYRLEVQTQTLVLMAHRGLSERFVADASRLPLEVGMAGKRLDAEQPVVWSLSEYPEGELKQRIREEGLELVIAVPVTAKGRVLGGLVIGTKAPRPLGPEETWWCCPPAAWAHRPSWSAPASAASRGCSSTPCCAWPPQGPETASTTNFDALRGSAPRLHHLPVLRLPELPLRPPLASSGRPGARPDDQDRRLRKRPRSRPRRRAGSASRRKIAAGWPRRRRCAARSWRASGPARRTFSSAGSTPPTPGAFSP